MEKRHVKITKGKDNCQKLEFAGRSALGMSMWTLKYGAFLSYSHLSLFTLWKGFVPISLIKHDQIVDQWNIRIKNEDGKNVRKKRTRSLEVSWFEDLLFSCCMLCFYLFWHSGILNWFPTKVMSGIFGECFSLTRYEESGLWDQQTGNSICGLPLTVATSMWVILFVYFLFSGSSFVKLK